MDKKLLIVEDNPVNLDIFNEIFEDGFNIKMVMDGIQALDIVESYMPDMIILDVMMPNMDGYEVCKKIRSNPKLSNIKVIMVTARAMESERQKGMDAGADEYITKPFDEDELLERINSYFN